MKIITACLSLCVMSPGYCAEFEEDYGEETALIERPIPQTQQATNPFDFSQEIPVKEYTVTYLDWPKVNVIDQTGGHVELIPVKGGTNHNLDIYSTFKINYAGKRLKNMEGRDFRFVSPVTLTFTPSEKGVQISEIDMLTHKYKKILKEKPRIHLITHDYKLITYTIQEGVINVVDHQVKGLGEKASHPNCI